MFSSEILKEYGFVEKTVEIDEYNHLSYEKRWYYGPYLYLIKHPINDRMLLYRDIYGTEFENEKIDHFTSFEDDDIYSVIKACKDWYMELHKELTDKIVELEVEQENIANYIF